MNWKNVLAYASLLAMLTGVSVAQRGRLATGGTNPGARLPNAVHGGQTVQTGIPGQTRVGPTAQTTTTAQAPKKTTPSAQHVPNTMTTLPSTHEWGNRTVTPY